jgi:putative transposase
MTHKLPKIQKYSMIELKKSSHYVYRIRYHIVLCLKYRKKLLLEKEKIETLMKIFKGIEDRYYINFETVGCDGDHVHIFVEAKPSYSPSKVAGVIKSISARKMFEEFPEIKKELWGGEFWSDGGYIGTVAEGVNAEIIREYIKRQGSKEEKNGLKQMKILDF